MRRLFIRLAILLAMGTILPVWATEITRGPYLQLGTSDSIVVRWRTDENTVSKVKYGTTQGVLDQEVQIGGQRQEHEVALTGLLPDTRYYYAVFAGAELLAGNDANHFFDTAPPAGTSKPTRIWVLGDSGTANANVMAVRDAYYNFAGAQHTQLWLMLGDNAYPNGTDAEYQAALFDIFPEMLRKSVLWPTFGNHDAAASSGTSQFGPYFDMFTLPSQAEAGGLVSGTEAYYSFDYANVHFVVLDSMDSDRTPGGPMLTWLASDLAATDQKWIVAYWHHPPYSKGIHDSDDPVDVPPTRPDATERAADPRRPRCRHRPGRSQPQLRAVVPDRRALWIVGDVRPPASGRRRRRQGALGRGLRQALRRAGATSRGGPHGRRKRGSTQRWDA